uniref:protein-serine/threonine phosphatase n=1 Tax=Oreochromis aureus TaxID=47969 RepID=A0AAZ1XKI4_OREAU
MLKTRQCLLGIRTFLGVTSRIWGFIMYILRKHLRTIIQYQTVRYDTLPLSPISRNRLNAVKRKILVLDLDETLIHSHHDGVLRPTVRPGTPPDFILKVVIDKHPVRFFVHKRPHVDFFLEVVSQWYELVVFTASMEIYGSAVADKLDNNRNILKRRYYRQHCTLDLGSYIKDLSVVHDDLSSIVILDNSPGAYRSHPGKISLLYPMFCTRDHCKHFPAQFVDSVTHFMSLWGKLGPLYKSWSYNLPKLGNNLWYFTTYSLANVL